uniref:Amine oxidase domain-containing protein n=1 Tax=Chelonoidis abingdonii TaxID=106734 RepID=A0A8C0G074_CHEAB
MHPPASFCAALPPPCQGCGLVCGWGHGPCHPPTWPSGARGAEGAWARLPTHLELQVLVLLQFLLLVVAPSLEILPSKLKEWEKCFTDPDYEELVDIAENGLEKGCRSKKMVIIGAGISGLTAVKLLQDAECKVLILDASDHVGGRIMTYHNKDRSWYVDLGPMYISLAVILYGGIICMHLPPSPHFPAQEYLIKEGNLSRGAINMIGDLLNEDGEFQMSFLHSVMDHVTLSEKGYDEITGGFDQLPDTFYQYIHGGILFHSIVVKIVNKDDQVRVFYQRPDALIALTVTSDYVLVMAMAKATWLIQFSPFLLTNKAHALGSIHYSEATKIREYRVGGQSLIVYPDSSTTPATISPVILASYTWGDDAELFIPLSDEKCVNVVLGDLVEIHQVPKNYIQSVCDKHVMKKWSLDKYTMGSYVSFTPYQFADYSEALFQNEGRVHFAEELTAHPHAWIKTTMKSAVRVARNIHAENLATPLLNTPAPSETPAPTHPFSQAPAPAPPLLASVSSPPRLSLPSSALYSELAQSLLLSLTPNASCTPRNS